MLNKLVNFSKDVLNITKKELGSFFISPIAYLFLLSFSLIVLFIFFWFETFFARNISDLRPMFEWMPVLLIFLASALSMKMFSEEKRLGTIEHILTTPKSIWIFILGKLSALKILLVIALCITLPLSISISFITNIDYGVLFSAYLATIFLGVMYLSIGLWISSISQNQIVSLILSVFICGFIYLLGTDFLKGFFSINIANILNDLGSGSRFVSITRGVLDLGDLYYYLSVSFVFLILTYLSLLKISKSKKNTSKHESFIKKASILWIANLLFFNVLITPLNLRFDMTDGNIYTLSDASKNYIDSLKEPLLIRGYFSAKTHPLLAPLVPQVEDLLNEYKIQGKDKVIFEFIDPAKDPKKEEEALTKYNIKPVPFQLASRYESSIVNSYFNILIEYAGEYKILGFNELIDIKYESESDMQVALKNPEFDITKTIKNVVDNYTSKGNLFYNIEKPIEFIGYISNDNLPDVLVTYKKTINQTLSELKEKAQGKFEFSFVDPALDPALIEKISSDFGFKPMRESIFSPNTFYFYMILKQGDEYLQIPLSENFSKDELQIALDSGLKRFAPGFVKNIVLVTPKADLNANPMQYQMMQAPPRPDKNFETLRQILLADFNVQNIDIKNQRIPDNTDVLMLLAPEDLTDDEILKIDQYLMRGGNLVISSANVKTKLENTGLSATKNISGISQWLESYGIKIGEKLITDEQNIPFPIPVTRNVNGYQLEQLELLDYPFFIDIRGESFNKDLVFSNGINQMAMPFASEITLSSVDNLTNQVLFSSSENSTLAKDLNIMPTIDEPFFAKENASSFVLATMTVGVFDSYFIDKELFKEENKANNTENTQTNEINESQTQQNFDANIIEKSSPNAKIVVIASNDFATDEIASVLSASSGMQYRQASDYMRNIVTYLTEDTMLLEIPKANTFNRTLPSMNQKAQKLIEYLNYFLALGAIFIVYLICKIKTKSTKKRQKKEYDLTGL